MAAEFEGPLLTGLDDALLGILECRDGVRRAVYDRDAIVGILVERDGMTPDDAEEFFDFNIWSLYLGPATPLFTTIRCRED